MECSSTQLTELYFNNTPFPLNLLNSGHVFLLTAPRVANVQGAVEHIYPLVLKHHIPKSKVDPRVQIEAPYKRAANIESLQVYQRFKYKKREEGYSSDEECYGGKSGDSDSSLE